MRSLLDDVLEEWSDCRRCRLCRARRNVVLYRGHPSAHILLVGEAPGSREDQQGLPFVGPAGKLLDRLIRKAGLDPDIAVLVTNLVGCRPPKNRQPDPEEIADCRDRLNDIATATDIRAVVLLGKVAREALLGERRTTVVLAGARIPARATHHPARLLRERLDVGRRQADEIVDALRWAAERASRSPAGRTRAAP